MHPFFGRSKALILAGLWLAGMAAPVESQTPVGSRPTRTSAGLPHGSSGFSRNTIPSRRAVSPFGSGTMSAATRSRTMLSPGLVRQKVIATSPSPQPAPAPVFTQNSGTNLLVFPGTNPFFFSGTLFPPETLRFMLLEQAALNASLNPGGSLFAPGFTSLFPPGLNSLMPPGLTSLLPPGVNVFPFSPTPNFLLPPNTVFPIVPRVNLVPFVGVIPLLAGGLSLPGALPLVVGLSAETDFAPNGERELNKNMRLMKSQNQAFSTGAESTSKQNRLLDGLETHANRSGRDVPLSEEVVPHIRLALGKSTGSAGLLKIGPWPELLQRSAFQGERDQIDALIPELTRRAKAGSIQPADLENLAQTISDMQERLAGLIQKVPDPQYIRAKRFLANLEDAVKALGQPVKKLEIRN
jgi:hypothetical protein